ncbi:M28 family metallopeptidase [Agromyces sp. NPDC058484]|uniref:M28 family metallopeptidase n=1 Tax=Agromyces sp. NPDC058484 TaxID=3346524 RepID=UPI00365A0BA5
MKCHNRNNNTVSKLLECVDADGAFEHLEALQAIADENGGNRAAGLPGYDASVEYVASTLEDYGWDVTIEEFPFKYVGPSELEQLTPVNAVYETGPFTGTGYGEVTGTVIPVDVNLVGDRASTSGCEAADFAGLDFSGASDIALIQRGSCAFADKAINAEAAGAEAVIIFNQGNTPEREELIVGTLGGDDVVGIPVVGASFAQGEALAQQGSTARVMVPQPEDRPQKNVIAELPGRNEDNIVMAGAHLDSVQAGPGINDNGSGSAALLEVAERLRKLKPQNTVRLAWWGAEESGLIGSEQYVASLSQVERSHIALYLNFDMVASPNYIYMIYDGDQSGFEAPVAVPEGSVQIEDLFESYFTSVGQPYDDAEFSGRSDYQAFIENDIPAGGLFTGAEVVKNEEQEAIWGGVAGEAFDQCYHQACDDIENVDLDALDVNVDAIALAVLAYSYSTESVNGVPGKPVRGGLNLPAPAGPEMTWSAGGGGYHHDHEPTDLD